MPAACRIALRSDLPDLEQRILLGGFNAKASPAKSNRGPRAISAAAGNSLVKWGHGQNEYKTMRKKTTQASLEALKAGTLPVIQWDLTNLIKETFTVETLLVEQVDTGLQFDGSSNLSCTICIGTEKATHSRRFIFTGVVSEAEVKSLSFAYEPDWGWNEYTERSQAEYDVLDYIEQHHPDLLVPTLENLDAQIKKDLSFAVIYDHINSQPEPSDEKDEK